MKWPWKRRLHNKHKFFFVGRSGFGTHYVFECSVCTQRTIIAQPMFWGNFKPNSLAAWLWNNA